jgi:hypothetical protein
MRDISPPGIAYRTTVAASEPVEIFTAAAFFEFVGVSAASGEVLHSKHRVRALVRRFVPMCGRLRVGKENLT